MRLGRILRSEEFADILRNGSRAQSRGIVLAHCDAAAGPRLGFAIGRSAGNAVQRNRFRRCVREFLRQHTLPKVDVVFSLRTQIKPLTNAMIRDSITILLRNNGWVA